MLTFGGAFNGATATFSTYKARGMQVYDTPIHFSVVGMIGYKNSKSLIFIFIFK